MILWTDTKGFNNKSYHPKILWCVVNDTLHPLSLWQALLVALSTPEKVRPWHERGQRVSELGSGWTHWPSFPSPSSGSGPGFMSYPVGRKNRSHQDYYRGWYQEIDIVKAAQECLSKISLRYIWAASTGRNPRTYLRVSVTNAFVFCDGQWSHSLVPWLGLLLGFSQTTSWVEKAMQ